MTLLKRLLRGLLLAPVALFLLFEEWGWEPLAAYFAALGRLPLWGRLERWIAGLPPRAALLVFGVPVLALVPIKLLALYLFGQGHVTLGLGLIVAAKLAGTAVAARLFQLTHPALMTMPWFARLYGRWKIWKDRILAQVRDTWAWHMGRRLKRRARFWGARLLAALKSARF
ncbi:hypothetical protein [Polaromonas jejuensis]|uniref:Transmembrane protein n=1 Tax=Polaromonas jejuensis TaxID=457502 RepID=A0ABW0QEV0_9BURK|nr:hypothetical protein [Polaromonas jejuensis]